MKNRQQNLIWCLVLLGGLLCAQNKQLEKAHTMYEDLAYIEAKDLYTKLQTKAWKMPICLENWAMSITLMPNTKMLQCGMPRPLPWTIIPPQIIISVMVKP